MSIAVSEPFQIKEDADEKEHYKWILNKAPHKNLNLDINKESTAKITEITETYWHEFLETRFYKKHAPTLVYKRRIFDQLLIEIIKAYRGGYVLKLPLNNNELKNRKLFEQVKDYLEYIGACRLHKSKKCYPQYTKLKQSRIEPIAAFFETKEQQPVILKIKHLPPVIEKVPWVQIKKKDPITKEKIPLLVDEKNLLVRKRTEILQTIDWSWRLHKFWYREYLGTEKDENNKDKIIYGEWKQFAAQPYCIFTNDLEHGGRIYTKTGITTLRKEERATLLVEINGRKYKVIELDAKVLHAFIAYAKELKEDYQEDAYKLLTDLQMDALGWNEKTRDAFRDLCKICFQATLNAADKIAAIRACNKKLSSKTKDRNGNIIFTTGIAAARAEKLRAKMDLCKVPFKEIYQLIRDKHPRLAALFDNGESTGLEYQRIDSDITLRICHHFARKGICCLPLHDSWIVPAQYEAELRAVIRKYFIAALGCSPQIDKK